MHQRLISKITDTSNKSNWKNFQPRIYSFKKETFKKKCLNVKQSRDTIHYVGLYIQIP